MRVLIVPMFALSRMGGPWSRAQKIAAAFMGSGHDVTMGVSADGNCIDPVAPSTLELPVPSPLGLPMAISSKTFLLVNRLGIAGRKPVRSFEEVLWLAGALAYGYEARSVEAIRRHIRDERPDVVYSEFSLPAVIAAQVERVPCVGTVSYPTQASYACDPEKARGVRRLMAELGLPDVSSSLDLFGLMGRRFVPSCAELEPFEDADVVFCGFLDGTRRYRETLGDARHGARRDAAVVYMGTGSVSRATLMSVAKALANAIDLDIYVAGAEGASDCGGRLHLAGRFDFSELLPRTRVFVNHGGQNSVMDALAYGVPQVIYPGRVFERRFNARSVVSADAGVRLERFSAASVLEAVEKAAADSSIARRAEQLRETMCGLGGATTIVAEVERMLA